MLNSLDSQTIRPVPGISLYISLFINLHIVITLFTRCKLYNGIYVEIAHLKCVFLLGWSNKCTISYNWNTRSTFNFRMFNCLSLSKAATRMKIMLIMCKIKIFSLLRHGIIILSLYKCNLEINSSCYIPRDKFSCIEKRITI